MTKQILPLVPLCFFLSFSFVQAQWSSDPAVNNPIVRAGNNQSWQRIVSDGKGGAIICWNDERAQTNSYDIYAQRIDKDGFVRWTINGVGVCTAPASQEKPDIASDGAGGAIIVWTDNRDGVNDVYAQRIDSTGTPLWTTDGIPVATGSNNQTGPVIVSDGNKGAIITWSEGTGGFPPGSKLYAQRFDANGKALWHQDVLISGTLRFSAYPSIASDGRGGAYIAYAYYPRPQYDVYAQLIDSSGAVQWASRGIPIATGSTTQDSPRIVEDGAGNAFLGYLNWTSSSLANLHIVVLKRDGSQAASFRATSTSGGQSSHHLANLGTGLLGVAWEDGRSAGKKRVFAQIIDTTGAKFWAEDGVDVSNRTGNQVTPFVISDGADGVIVAWDDQTAGLLHSDIYAQRLSGTGSPMWSNAGAPVSIAANMQQLPRMVSDGENGAIVTWEDYRPSLSNAEVYASRILADGTFPVEPPILTFSSKTVDLGVTDLNSFSTRDITLSNTGGVPITIASITSSDTQFSLTPESNTIAPGGNVAAEVKFQPASKNTFNAFIVVHSNSIFAPDTVRVSGEGSAVAAIETDKSSLDFGNVEVGTSKDLTLRISNTGSEALNISDISVSGTQFSVSINSRTLAPGTSFDNTVTFTPASPGPVSANLTLTSNAPSSPTIVPMTGSGVGVVTMTIDPASISFGEVTLGAHKDASFTVTNTGNDTLHLISFASGDASFSVVDPVTSIAPAGAGTLTLRFQPAVAGALSSVITITSNALSSPDTIDVDGVGLDNAVLAFTPSHLTFGEVDVDEDKDLTLTINNTGGLTLTVTAITSTNPYFSALTGQFDVPGGGSFDETIRYAPGAVGEHSGMLIIASNAATSPDTVLVSGTGKDVSTVEHIDATPGTFTLSQNYPNPFNPSTSIVFSIPAQGTVRLTVLDPLGREIAVLADGEYPAGTYTCLFDAAEHTSGLYMYRLSFNGATMARKMLLLR
jgi:hypothetical protein